MYYGKVYGEIPYTSFFILVVNKLQSIAGITQGNIEKDKW